MGLLGDILGPVIGGIFDNKQQSRDIRYQREFAQNAIQWRTDDAVAAGVHPLFAMGANTTSFQPSMGSGSAAGDAVRQISQNVGNRELVNLQKDLIKEQIENSKYRRETDRANSTQERNVEGITIPGTLKAAQEIDKGKVQPFRTKNPEQNLSVISPITTMRMGTQRLKIPVEETDQIMEDPAMVAVATYFYHGNKDVDWMKLLRDYTGRELRPGASLAKRNPKAMKSGAYMRRFVDKLRKLTRRQKVQNTFFRKKPRQTRGF